MTRHGLAACAILVLAASLAPAVPCVTLEVVGDTFAVAPRAAFSLLNESDGGEQIVRFRLDISTALPEPAVFDTVTGVPPNETNGHDLTPVAGSGATVGLVALPGTPQVADGASLLDLCFTHFEPGEGFFWNIDVDAADGSPATVFGSQLEGAIVYVNLDSGAELRGTLARVGASDAARVTLPEDVPPPVIPEPATLTLCFVGLVCLRARHRRRGAR